jgi:UDP-glucose 4-epimerase
MNQVLIIGATGGTGKYLTKYLSDKKYRVFTTGQQKRDTNYFNYPNVSYQTLDVTDKAAFATLPTENISCVVLLAGMMPARMEGYDPHKYIDVNITGTLNVLEFCRENRIKKVIFTQSHADVYAHWDTGSFIPSDANRALNLKGDHAVYIISKCAAVDMMEHYHQQYGIQTIVLRLPTIYSYMPAATMYIDGKIQDMACMYMIDRATKGEEIEIWGDPQKSKDIVYIKDFINIVEAAISSDTAQGIFNVGTGIPTSLEQQIRGIVEVFSDGQNQSNIVYRPEKRSQTSYLYDISRTEQELNYKVQYPYMEMLQDMKQEMLAQKTVLI